MMSVWKAIGGWNFDWRGACEKEGLCRYLARTGLFRKNFKCKGAFFFCYWMIVWWAFLSRLVGNEGPGASRLKAAVGVD